MSTTSGTTSASSVLDQYKISSRTTDTANDELGKDAFLELLVAQLNNQNPLEPQDNGEFVAQLATFSTLESLDSLNTTVESILSGYQSGQALEAASLVGHSVVLKTDKTIVDTSKTLNGMLDLPVSSDNVYVNIYNSSGVLVRQVDVGAQAAGAVAFTWDGADSDGNVLPSGSYTFKAESKQNGATTGLTTYLPATVESVTLAQDGGEMTLNIPGVGAMPLSSVQVVGR